MSNLIKSKLFQRPDSRLGEMSGGVNKLCQKVEEDERERQKRNSIRNGVKNEGVTEDLFQRSTSPKLKFREKYSKRSSINNVTVLGGMGSGFGDGSTMKRVMMWDGGSKIV